MTELGRNPGRIIPAIREFLDTCPGRATSFVGEPIWPGRSPAEVAEATRHEALINTAFARADTRVLCPYDTSRLDPAVVRDAARTHPELVTGRLRRPSHRFTDPAVLCDAAAWPLPSPPATAVVAPFAAHEVRRLRGLVRAQADAAGLAADRADDLLLAVDELVANTAVHGTGRGTLRTWREPGTLVVEVSDGGRITDLLAGRRLPPPDAESGRGLWIVNRLCDLVQVRSGADGTTVRLHMASPDTAVRRPVSG